MKFSGNKGFTIVEVISAIVVGAILLTGIAVMTQSIRTINARTQDMIVLNSTVEDKIEQLRSQTFLALQDGTYDFADELPASIAKPRQATYQVTTVQGNASLKEILVEITYNDYGQQNTFEYKTFIGELGVGQY